MRRPAKKPEANAAAATEQRLRAFYSAEHLRLVWGNPLVGLRLTDAEGRVLLVNEVCCRLLRQPRVGLEGHWLSAPYPPAEAARMLREHRRRFRDRCVAGRRETEVALADGTRLRLELCDALLEVPGEPPLQLTLMREVAAGCAAERLSAAGERPLGLALATAGLVAWEWDVVSGSLKYSGQVARRADGGHLAACATVESLLRSTHPKDRAALAAAFEASRRDGVPFDCVYRVRGGDRNWRWIHGQGRVVRRIGGQAASVIGVSEDITARRAAEEAMQASELRHRLLFEHSPVAILEQDFSEVGSRLAALGEAGVMDFRAHLEAHPEEVGAMLARVHVVEANQRCRELLGNVPREQLTAAWLQCLTDASVAVLQRWLIALAEGLTVFEGELPVRDFRGQPRVLDLQAAVLIGHEASLSRVLVSLLDITARRAGEIELRKLSRAVEQSPAAVIITDTEGRIEYVNARFTEDTGYTPAEALGQNARLLKSGGMSADVYEQLWQTIASGAEWRGELLNRRKDGQPIWEAASISPVVDPNRRITHYVAIMEDVTQRKRDLARLAASEQRFRALFQAAPMPLALHGSDGHYLEVNAAYAAMLGYSMEEIVRTGCRALTHPEDVAEGQRLFTEVRAGRLTGYQRDKRFIGRGGRIVFARSNTSAVRGEGGELLFILSIVQDTTAQRRAAARKAALADLAVALSAATTTEEAARIVTRVAGELLPWDAAYLNIVHPRTQEVTWLARFDTIKGRKTQLDGDGFRSRPSPLTCEIMRHGARLVNVRRRGFRAAGLPPLSPFGDARRPSASMMFAPLRFGGKPVGVISLQSYSPNAYTPEDLEVLQAIADHSGGALERIHAEAEWRRVGRELLAIGQGEQDRISRELHEEVTVALGDAVQRAAQLVDGLRAAGGSGAEQAGQVLRMLERAVAGLRSLARGLAPVELADGGLPAALERLCQDARARHGVRSRFVGQLDAARVQPAIALHLFRIAQEAVGNALRHGQPKQLTLTLKLAGTELRLSIRDNGRGFKPASQPGGVGMAAMRHRAEIIGGTLTIVSRPGRGTRVECRLPATARWEDASATQSPQAAELPINRAARAGARTEAPSKSCLPLD